MVLGATGHNFAAGMSGGIAYVLDSEGRFVSRCNRDLVGLGRIEDPGEADEVRTLIEEHRDRTAPRWPVRCSATGTRRSNAWSG